jgi:photosystem II stability/assembly factor-like uncharacterized protein
MLTIPIANIALIFSIFFMFIVNVNAQENNQWELLNEGLPGELNYEGINKINFVNAQIGWLIGARMVLKTMNGGDTWNKIIIPEEIFSETIDFQTELIGWAMGQEQGSDNYGLFKTLNGGQSWILKKEFSGNNLETFFVVSDSVLYATVDIDVGECSAWIMKTTDSGTSWENVSPSFYNQFVDHRNSIYFFNELIGIATSSCNAKTYVDRTIDGGRSWERLNFTEFNYIYNFQSLSASTFYFSASNYDTETNYLCSTTDTFKTWSVNYMTEESIPTYFLYDYKTIFAIMVDSFPSFQLNKSNDSGRTWERKLTLFWNLKQINFKDNDVGFILGNNGLGSTLWKSSDGGNTWQNQFFKYPFRDVFFLNQNDGFAIGGEAGCFHGLCWSEGILFDSQDGGNNWEIGFTAADNSPESGFNSIHFFDDNVGFLLNHKNIYKTYNGGNNWSEVNINNPDSLNFNGNDIFFLNDNNGWMVGKFFSGDSCGAFILETVDGGENWDLDWKYPEPEEYSYDLNSIHAVNTAAWAVGESGLIVKFTEHDQWQLQSAITDLPLKDVFFSDEDHGWIAGGYLNDQDFQSIIIKTNNGGANWQENNMGIFQINDMLFEDSLHGWAVGSDTTESGVILETIDGGNTWTTQVEGLSASLNAFHFKDGYGWAVGGNGLVLRYDGVTWIDQKTGKTYPNKFSLSQNYPNPFNPQTTIKYQLSEAGEVNLELYNVLGQLVTTIFKGNQKAGYYERNFNINILPFDLATGLYILQLRAIGGNSTPFIKNIKMLLLK